MRPSNAVRTVWNAGAVDTLHLGFRPNPENRYHPRQFGVHSGNPDSREQCQRNPIAVFGSARGVAGGVALELTGAAQWRSLYLLDYRASCRPSDPITTRLTTTEFTRGRRTGWTAVSLQRRLHNLADIVEKKLRHRADRPVFQGHNANWPR